MDYFLQFTEIELLVNTNKEEAMFLFKAPSPMHDESLKDFLKALKVQIPQIYGVTIETTGEDESKIENFGNCSLPFQFSFTPSSENEPICLEIRNRIQTFNQINLEQNRNLMQIIYEWGSPFEGKQVVDLFCGMGNLSLPLAGKAGRIIGLENNTLAVEDARENAKLNGFSNCEFHLANVYSDLSLLSDIGEVDVLIVDPPRKGAKECIGNIAALKPKKILYVSCNPTTLARDASLFSYARYRLNRIQLLDMFPQTYHIESVAEFLPET